MIIKIAEALKINPADLFLRDASKDKMALKNRLKLEFKSILAKI